MKAIVFPDVELFLTQRFRERFPDVDYIGRKVPRDLEHRRSVIAIRRQGGETWSAFLDVPRVGINVYARTEQEAGDLAREARGFLHTIPELKRVRTSGPAEATTDTNLERRYFTSEFSMLAR